MTDQSDVLRKSVTENDQLEAGVSGAVNVFLGPSNWSDFWGAGLLEGIKGANGLPPYGSKRGDAILSETPLIENMWASAVNTAISKQVALGFTIKDASDSQIRIRNAQKLMLGFDGNWNQGLSRHLRDFLCTDNGAFIEIVRQSNAAGSKVLGLRHLDSLRCYRTGDPQRPVMYMDSHGVQHLLNDYDVIMLSDMPSARVELRGFGVCAARRAFETILKMVAMETYVREKVSGSRNLAIHIVNGITAQQLDGALLSSDNANKGRGFVVYKGSTIIPMLKSEPPSVVTIPLAEIPDGFNATDERRDAYLRYANALGIFVGEIQPLSGQGLGTGTQSVVLEQAAEGRGLTAWMRGFEHAITHDVLPNATTFNFAVSDIKDRQLKAQTLQAWAGALKTLVDTQIITAPQALNVLVDDGYMPREFLQQDNTAGGVVSDNDSVATNAEIADNQPTIESADGNTLDVEQNKSLRLTLKSLKQISSQMNAKKYLTDETYVGKSPADTISSSDVADLLKKTSAYSRRIVSSVTQ